MSGNNKRLRAGRKLAVDRGLYDQAPTRSSEDKAVTTTSTRGNSIHLRLSSLIAPAPVVASSPQADSPKPEALAPVPQPAQPPSQLPSQPRIFTWENRKELPDWARDLIRHIVSSAPLKADRTAAISNRNLGTLKSRGMAETSSAYVAAHSVVGDRALNLRLALLLPAGEPVKVVMKINELVRL